MDRDFDSKDCTCILLGLIRLFQCHHTSHANADEKILRHNKLSNLLMTSFIFTVLIVKKLVPE